MTTIVYHGLGYVGLTGACHFVGAGVRDVIGYDPAQEVVDAINAGKPKAGEFLGYLGGDHARLPRATADFASIAREGIHILAVPTERADEPYMAIVEETVARLLATVPAGATIIIESTLTPGTIDRILAAAGGTRITSGEVFLIHAPRRDWFADPAKNVGNMVRVVGTYGDHARAMAVAILGIVTPVELIKLTDYRTAELVKPLENALFQAPIALAHELAVAYPDADVAEAVTLAATHWRFASFGGLYVGLGAGGRCVPMGPKYLMDGVRDRALSGADEMRYGNFAVMNALAKWITDRTIVSVLICGVAYRPGFSDFGGSPGLALADAIRVKTKGLVRVRLHDPYLKVNAAQPILNGHDVIDDQALVTYLGASDVVVLGTPHEQYREVPVAVAWRPRSPTPQRVFDARGLWAGQLPDHVDYRQVGKPGWLGV